MHFALIIYYKERVYKALNIWVVEWRAECQNSPLGLLPPASCCPSECLWCSERRCWFFGCAVSFRSVIKTRCCQIFWGQQRHRVPHPGIKLLYPALSAYLSLCVFIPYPNFCRGSHRHSNNSRKIRFWSFKVNKLWPYVFFRPFVMHRL